MEIRVAVGFDTLGKSEQFEVWQFSEMQLKAIVKELLDKQDYSQRRTWLKKTGTKVEIS